MLRVSCTALPSHLPRPVHITHPCVLLVVQQLLQQLSQQAYHMRPGTNVALKAHTPEPTWWHQPWLALGAAATLLHV